MYHSKIVVIAWLVVFGSAIVAAIIKLEMKGLIMILAGAGIMGAGIMVSQQLNSEYGAIFLSICLLASVLVALLGIIRVFKHEEKPE
jgi:hypothetical protein